MITESISVKGNGDNTKRMGRKKRVKLKESKETDKDSKNRMRDSI